MPRSKPRAPKDMVHTSYRLSKVCVQLIDFLSERNGIPKVSVIEMSVRDYARRLGIDPVRPS